jgi:hypothetical protein
MGPFVSMKCGASVKIANHVCLSPIITKFSKILNFTMLLRFSFSLKVTAPVIGISHGCDIIYTIRSEDN